MFKKISGAGLVTLVGALVLGTVAVWALPSSAEAAYGGGRRGGARAQAAAEPVRLVPFVDDVAGDLTESEVDALLMALDDEYKAWSVYDEVIDDFGAVRPFTNIQRAEEKHIAALVTLFDRYGLDVPENEWPGNVPTFSSLGEACEAGVQAEIDNAALYDQLFSMVENQTVIRVFTSLQQASQTKHLVAFQRCAR